VMLAAGLNGIEHNVLPPEPTEENIYSLDNNELSSKSIDCLPGSLFEALELSENSDLCKETLGTELFDRYMDIKRREWNDFKIEVTEWETRNYGEIY